MADCRYPRLAGLRDLPRLTTGDNVVWQWPPPGTDAIVLGFPEPWPLVCGTPSEGDSETWWVGTLGDVTGMTDSELEELVLSAAIRVNPVVGAAYAGGLSHYPVIYTYSSGVPMKWIRSIFKGELGGGVETFQFKLDWGNPGSDPTLGEAEAGAFAEFLRDQWAAIWIAIGDGGQIPKDHFHSDVVFTEVGVAQWQQDTPRDADGEGGDEHQVYPNAWAAYAVGSKPTGANALKSLPYEVSCCVTLQTDKRGPRGRGRLYLPPFVNGMMAEGGVFMNTGPVTLGGAIGDLFDAVSGSSYGYDPIVVSMRAKELHAVKEINIGNVPDAQRRRRRSQEEARVVCWTA